MLEEQFDGQMIEIGDPTEEPAVPEPPTRVVIEYRERGVPWMLIPPLLVISAAGAVLAYHKLKPPPPRPQPVVLVKAPDQPIVPISRPEKVESAPPIEPLPPAVVESKAAPSATIEKPPAAEVAGPNVPPVVIEPPPDVPSTSPEPAVKPEKAPTFPRVEGLGFDPKALEAAVNPEAPADAAIAPAAQGGRAPDPGQGTDRAAPPDLRNQPREVDPELLPPDPREAQARRARRLVELREMVETERANFHADLKEICQKFGAKSARKEIDKLYTRYDSTVDPLTQKRAAKLLGTGGAYEGVSTLERIKLLRSLGYPEPSVLHDLVEQTESYESDAARNGFRSKSELIYHCSMLLLKHPPARSRPAPTSRVQPAASRAAGATARAAGASR